MWFSTHGAYTGTFGNAVASTEDVFEMIRVFVEDKDTMEKILWRLVSINERPDDAQCFKALWISLLIASIEKPEEAYLASSVVSKFPRCKQIQQTHFFLSEDRQEFRADC